jgi:hypothetical protein
MLKNVQQLPLQFLVHEMFQLKTSHHQETVLLQKISQTEYANTEIRGAYTYSAC